MGSARKEGKAALEFPKSPPYALAALHRQLEDPQLHYLRRVLPRGALSTSGTRISAAQMLNTMAG